MVSLWLPRENEIPASPIHAGTRYLVGGSPETLLGVVDV